MRDAVERAASRAASWCRCRPPAALSARTVFVIVTWCAAFFLGTMLGSMPVTLIAMVKPSGDGGEHPAANLSGACPRPQQDVDDTAAAAASQDGEFEWDAMTQSYLLTAGGYGSLASSLVGARLAEMFGPRRVLAVAFVSSAVLNLLCPIAARLWVWLLVAARALQGCLMGCVMPGATILFASWIPPAERGKFSGIVFSAMIFSNLFTMLVSGNLATALGWDAIFYFYGVLMLPFCVAWVYLIYDSPLEHPRISEEEKNYILSSTQKETRKILSVPWLKILTSPPVWAILVVNVSVQWLSNTLVTELPLYMRNFLHFNINQSTYLSALPHIFQFVSNVVCGLLSQWLRSRGYLGHLTAYRIFNGVAMIGPAVILFCITLVGCNVAAIVALLIVTMVLNGAFFGGSLLNHLDVSVNFAGSISAVISTLTGCVHIVAPTVAGAITSSQTAESWGLVFFIAGAISALPYGLFLLFGSVEEQPWNQIVEKEPPQEDSQAEKPRPAP